MASAYYATELTGGGATALDFYDGTPLLQDDLAFVLYNGVSYEYKLNASSSDSESSPDRIRPDTNYGTAPNIKMWELQPNRSATNTYAGKVQLATSAETITGTDPDKAVTPETLHANIASNAEAEAKTDTGKMLVPSNLGALFLDEDNMVSDSDTKLSSQQAIKAYVDTMGSIPSGERILFYKDTAVVGYTLVNADGRMVYVTKGSAAGGETGGATHSSGSWTITGLTADYHTHAGPTHTHTVPDHVHTMATVGSTASYTSGAYIAADVGYLRVLDAGSSVAAVVMDHTMVDGTSTTSNASSGSTGSASATGVTGDGTWRPNSFCCTLQQRI